MANLTYRHLLSKADLLDDGLWITVAGQTKRGVPMQRQEIVNTLTSFLDDAKYLRNELSRLRNRGSAIEKERAARTRIMLFSTTIVFLAIQLSVLVLLLMNNWGALFSISALVLTIIGSALIISTLVADIVAINREQLVLASCTASSFNYLFLRAQYYFSEPGTCATGMITGMPGSMYSKPFSIGDRQVLLKPTGTNSLIPLSIDRMILSEARLVRYLEMQGRTTRMGKTT